MVYRATIQMYVVKGKKTTQPWFMELFYQLKKHRYPHRDNEFLIILQERIKCLVRKRYWHAHTCIFKYCPVLSFYLNFKILSGTHLICRLLFLAVKLTVFFC